MRAFSRIPGSESQRYGKKPTAASQNPSSARLYNSNALHDSQSVSLLGPSTRNDHHEIEVDAYYGYSSTLARIEHIKQQKQSWLSTKNIQSHFVKDNKGYISPEKLKHSIQMLYGISNLKSGLASTRGAEQHGS